MYKDFKQITHDQKDRLILLTKDNEKLEQQINHFKATIEKLQNKILTQCKDFRDKMNKV